MEFIKASLPSQKSRFPFQEASLECILRGKGDQQCLEVFFYRKGEGSGKIFVEIDHHGDKGKSPLL